MEIPVSNVNVVNKSGKKIRGEVTYNANTQQLTFTIYDREDTVYIDVNPTKSVNLPAKWIHKSEGEISVEVEPTYTEPATEAEQA